MILCKRPIGTLTKEELVSTEREASNLTAVPFPLRFSHIFLPHLGINIWQEALLGDDIYTPKLTHL
jgi:hypothetical protein